MRMAGEGGWSINVSRQWNRFINSSNFMHNTSTQDLTISTNISNWTNGGGLDFWNCSADDEYCDPTTLRLRRIVDKLDLYLIPAIIAIGLLGNFLSILVFSGTYLRRMSSSVYLTALAVTDIVFLLIILVTWLSNFDVVLVHTHVWCQLFVYLTYVTSFLSVWYVVCFTVERHLTVCFPLKRQIICQPRRSKIVVGVLAGVAMILYSFALWTSNVDFVYDQPTCGVHDEKYYDIVTNINNADTLITLVLPAVIITVCNIRISYALSKFYRSYQAVHVVARSNSTTGSLRSTTGPALYSNSSYNRFQMRVTKMLLLVSSVFLLCNIPSHAIRVYAFSRMTLDDEFRPTHRLLLVQRLAMLLYYTGFSSNFILYNISGRTFRRAFVRLFRCLAARLVGFVCTRFIMIRSRHHAQPKTVIRLRFAGHDCAYN